MSEEGRGATFRIELPQKQEGARSLASKKVAPVHGSAAMAKPPIEVA
jgi:hypothetical protein